MAAAAVATVRLKPLVRLLVCVSGRLRGLMKFIQLDNMPVLEKQAGATSRRSGTTSSMMRVSRTLIRSARRQVRKTRVIFTCWHAPLQVGRLEAVWPPKRSYPHRWLELASLLAPSRDVGRKRETRASLCVRVCCHVAIVLPLSASPLSTIPSIHPSIHRQLPVPGTQKAT